MLKHYIRERISWIFLFLFLQLLSTFIVYIDSALSLRPFLYTVFLSFIIFSVFFFFRYQKETAFFKSVVERKEDLDLTSLPEPASPFEKIIISSMITQTERLREEAGQNQLMLEQEKDDLLAWIHEVKTPLTAMHLIIERIEEQDLKASLMHEWLRIHLLLDQQLHKKRIPFMENDLYIARIDLEDILFHEIKSLQSWCLQKGIGFDIEIEEQDAVSDAKWLAFIIRQILTNAVKYSQEADIVIHTRRKDGQLSLIIQDWGRGIAQKDLPRIFDKGFTSTVQHEDHAATGMGLYLAKKAAEPLNIHLSVESKLGEGTTFTLLFPKSNELINITGM
jgi:OmpR family two-component system bacitracin resistance sensor histidine kinase BceS